MLVYMRLECVYVLYRLLCKFTSLFGCLFVYCREISYTGWLAPCISRAVKVLFRQFVLVDKFKATVFHSLVFYDRPN